MSTEQLQDLNADNGALDTDLGIEFDDGVIEGEIVEGESQGNANSGAATDSEGQHDKNADSDESNGINQEAVNRRIAQKHKEAREAEERAIAAESELARLRGAQSNDDKEPEIPAFPDRYSLSDEEFDNAMKTRDEALRQHAAWQGRLQQRVQAQTEAQNAQMKTFVENVNKDVESYTKRAEAFGMTKTDLHAIGETIGTYKIPDQLVLEMLKDEDGPLIAKFLSQSPADLEKLSEMTPVSAALYIERSVRQKAVQLKPKTTNAPAPATRVDGNKGDTELAKYPLTAGVQFDQDLSWPIILTVTFRAN